MTTHILLVDDEKEIADLLSVYLINEDYTVHTYYSSREALATLDKVKYDLAVLDVMMPPPDGFTMLKIIRENHTFPVIMLTAKVEEDVYKRQVYDLNSLLILGNIRKGTSPVVVLAQDQSLAFDSNSVCQKLYRYIIRANAILIVAVLPALGHGNTYLARSIAVGHIISIIGGGIIRHRFFRDAVNNQRALIFEFRQPFKAP